MHLSLGATTFDVTRRAVVLGVLAPEDGSGDDLLRRAEALAAKGADALDLGGVELLEHPDVDTTGAELDRLLARLAVLAPRIDLPLSVAVPTHALAEAARAGARLVGGRIELAAAAELGLSVVLPAGADIGAARRAGIAAERIVVDAGIQQLTTVAEARDLLREVGLTAGLGCCVLVEPPPGVPLPACAALAIGRGCRVVRTADVRGARRCADLMVHVLGARSEVRR